MSHRVELHDLAETVAGYDDTPFLLYVGASGGPRANHVRAFVESDSDDTAASVSGAVDVRVTGFGRGVAGPVAERSTLSLLWPAKNTGDFSLIVDGYGALANDVLTITATSAVLHRPAPADGAPRAC